MGPQFTLVVAESTKTKHKSIIVINKPGELDTLPSKLKLFIEKVEPLFYQFDERFELIDFAPAAIPTYVHQDFEYVRAFFIVKEKPSYKNHPVVTLTITPENSSLDNLNEEVKLPPNPFTESDHKLLKEIMDTKFRTKKAYKIL